MTTRTSIQPGDGDPRHGTTNGYVNLGCHCPKCKTAQAGYMNRYRERHRGTLTPDDSRHGTANGYSNYGCRCERCTEAKRLTRSTR